MRNCRFFNIYRKHIAPSFWTDALFLNVGSSDLFSLRCLKEGERRDGKSYMANGETLL